MMRMMGELEQKYMWNHAGTALLVSVWSDSSVQKQLRSTRRNQPIWDGVARFMMGKGCRVNGKQCRTRMKNILVRYREAKKTGNLNFGGIEPFYHQIDRVMTGKNLVAAGTSRSASSQDELGGLTERNPNNSHYSEQSNQDMVQVNLKLERNLSPTASDDSIQELQDQDVFQSVDISLDDEQSSSSMLKSPSHSQHSPVLVFKSDEAGAFQDDAEPEEENSDLNMESNFRQNINGMNTNESPQQTAQCIENLVIRTLQAQSKAVTKILNAQHQMFSKMMEADRIRQAGIEAKLHAERDRQTRIESKLDQLLCRIEKALPENKERVDKDLRFESLLDRLNWSLPPRQVEVRSRNEETKLDNLLDKLDKLIPVLNPQTSQSEENVTLVKL